MVTLKAFRRAVNELAVLVTRTARPCTCDTNTWQGFAMLVDSMSQMIRGRTACPAWAAARLTEQCDGAKD